VENGALSEDEVVVEPLSRLQHIFGHQGGGEEEEEETEVRQLKDMICSTIDATARHLPQGSVHGKETRHERMSDGKRISAS